MVKRAAMRRATMHLVLAVCVLDAVALLLYYFAIVGAGPRTRMVFAGLWTVATVGLVLVLLKRVRKARFGPTRR